MRKILAALGIMMTVLALPQQMPDANAEQQTPAYAKWGKLAIEKTQSSYPNSKIIDYLHEGSHTQGNSTTEKFKLWLKEGDREFGVFVRIEFTTESEEIIRVESEETDR